MCGRASALTVILPATFLGCHPRQQEAIEVNKVLSTPKAVLEAMARSISPDIYKSFTARYTKDIALEVRVLSVGVLLLFSRGASS